MDQYLKQHPEIFLPDHKEPQFFGSDLHSSAFVRDEKRYLALFEGARGEKRVGETSVWSLYSRQASLEIKAFQPAAGIIAMLRNPLEMIPSLHNQYLYTGNEDIENLEGALEAEEERKRGHRIPRRAAFAQGLFYKEAAKYARQLERYFDVFGRENVHVVIFDDLKEDPSKVYKDTLSFLEVDTHFKPAFEIVNPSKRVRSRALRDFAEHGGGSVRKALKALVPNTVRRTIMHSIERHNTDHAATQPLDTKVIEHLRTDFAREVELLSELLGRDLSHWLRPASPKASE